ncbi:MAG: phosphatase PAP2 family protein [candidate division KSB1 bacterium]|nr:phosphatase PAP2 family protein [candidate division KSB1 bacterium]
MKVFLTTMVQWDCALCLRIFRLNGRTLLDAVMYGLSRLGDGYFYALVGIVLFIVNTALAIQIVPVLLFAFALELTLYKILKNKTRRNRPFEILPNIRFLMHPPDKFSFPSGHTSAAFVMATIFSTFMPALTLPFILIAALIGFSRIYNGLHFPSDVIAGMALGVVCAKMSLSIIG